MIKSTPPPDVYIDRTKTSLWNAESSTHCLKSYHLRATCVLSASSVNIFIYLKARLTAANARIICCCHTSGNSKFYRIFVVARRLATENFPTIYYYQTSGNSHSTFKIMPTSFGYGVAFSCFQCSLVYLQSILFSKRKCKLTFTIHNGK